MKIAERCHASIYRFLRISHESKWKDVKKTKAQDSNRLVEHIYEWNRRLMTHAKGRLRLFNPNAYYDTFLKVQKKHHITQHTTQFKSSDSEIHANGVSKPKW